MFKIKRNRQETATALRLDRAFGMIGKIHAAAASGLLYLFRRAGAVLCKIPIQFRMAFLMLLASLLLFTYSYYGENLLFVERLNSIAEAPAHSASPDAESGDDAEDDETLPDSGEHLSIVQLHRLKESRLETVNADASLKGPALNKAYSARMAENGFNEDNLRFSAEQLDALYHSDASGALATLRTVNTAGLLIAGLLFLAALLSAESYVFRFLSKAAYWLLLAAGAAFVLQWICWLAAAFHVPSALLEMNRSDFDSILRNLCWFAYLWLWIPGSVFAFLLLLPLFLSGTKRAYGFSVKQGSAGDQWMENLACRGKNPGLYRGFYWAFGYHFFLLLVLPLLLRGCYFEDAYEIPQGDGGGAVEQYVKIVKPKKIKKKRFVLNPNSAMIFHVPTLDDVKHVEELEDATDNVYTATQLSGGIGPKKKGTRSGWPNGMLNARIRFIRLEYRGGDWDLDMGRGADYNMLLKLEEYGKGSFKIADNTESIKVEQLAHFRKDKKPPFLFITGKGSINLTARETKILRNYLIKEGGMIFADNAGGNFDASFRALCRKLFPELELVTISNDDDLFRAPFLFPNGAPKIFHHSGNAALGLRYNGRWLVFYHRGDLHDAWKTGSAGLSEGIREQAFKMGTNVIVYSFTQYMAQIYGDQFE